MKTKIPYILIITTLSACGGGPFFQPNEVSFNEKKSELSGELAIDCGFAFSWQDEKTNQCIRDAFQNKQPFTAAFIINAVFIKSNDTYAYNGDTLHKITGSSLACGGKSKEECDYYYYVYECTEARYVEIDQRPQHYKEPFKCSDELRLRGRP